MSDDESMFEKVGRWFRRRFSAGDDLPLLHGETETPMTLSRRSVFGWGKPAEDLSSLQNGLSSISALMTSLRQYLDQQNARHDELLTYLSQLSHALQAIPDSGRVQGETLRVLHQQIAVQNAQHKQLSEMLRQVTDFSGSQREIVELLRDRVESLYKNDQQIADTIQGMGDSILVVTQQSQANTMLLERLRDNLVNRDGALEQAIRRENRFTRMTMLIVGATSLAALAIAIGFAMYTWSALSKVTRASNEPVISRPISPEAGARTPAEPAPAVPPTPATAPETTMPVAAEASTKPITAQ